MVGDRGLIFLGTPAMSTAKKSPVEGGSVRKVRTARIVGGALFATVPSSEEVMSRDDRAGKDDRWDLIVWVMWDAEALDEARLVTSKTKLFFGGVRMVGKKEGGR